MRGRANAGRSKLRPDKRSYAAAEFAASELGIVAYVFGVAVARKLDWFLWKG